MVLIALILSLLLPARAFADFDWYFPMTNYVARGTVKPFGKLINDAFYAGKEKLFPHNRFYGYHSGVDLEVLPTDAQPVPVYAISAGTITFAGALPGYGGVVLEKLDLEPKTALYGHVKIANLDIQIGTKVKAGQLITYLGEPFSSETGRERQHLHFGIYNGTNYYTRGHEANLKLLNNNWSNPDEFLTSNNAVELQAPKPRPRAGFSISPSWTTRLHNWLQAHLGRFLGIFK